MTISIGLICKDAIVMATDSLITYAGSTHKTKNGHKLEEIVFRNGYAVIAMAGVCEYFDVFTERLESLAAETEIKSASTVPETIREAMRLTKKYLKKCYLPLARTATQWNRLYADNNFEIIVASYFQGRKQFYLFKFTEGFPREVKDPYEMAGTPQVVVNYILEGIVRNEMTAVQGMAMAAYIVHASTEHDIACGGEVQMAVIFPETPWILSQDEIAPFVAAAKKLETYKKQHWLKALRYELPTGLEKVYDRGPQYGRK